MTYWDHEKGWLLRPNTSRDAPLAMRLLKTSELVCGVATVSRDGLMALLFRIMSLPDPTPPAAYPPR